MSIISDYYSASDDGDIDRLVACFSNRATVVDEGRTYEARDDQHARRERLPGVFVTVEGGRHAMLRHGKEFEQAATEFVLETLLVE